MSNRSDREAAHAAHLVAARAIRRLGVLEWVILFGAVALALGGGAAVAWLLAEPVGVGFRPMWMGCSLFLFIVPGIIALTRARMADRSAAAGSTRLDID